MLISGYNLCMAWVKPQPKILERDVAKQVKDFLEQHRGWRAVRSQFAFVPGAFQTGQPGMPDWLFLRYGDNGTAHVLWIEVKGPNDKRRCQCRPGDRKVCKVCRQAAWAERERKLGARVWVVSDFDQFAVDYEREYGHLHRGEQAVGQLSLI